MGLYTVHLFAGARGHWSSACGCTFMEHLVRVKVNEDLWKTVEHSTLRQDHAWRTILLLTGIINHMNNLFSRLISKLLYHANSDVPSDYLLKRRFYLMKNRILWQYGKRDEKPIDWQRIIRYCWSCEGTGGKYHPYDCWKCGGSGVYSEKWILLARYCIAGRVFHAPGDALSKKPEFVEKPDISGYVQHKKSKYAWHCQAALALLFDWKLAKDLIADALIVRKWKNTARNLYNIARRCCICRKSVGKRAYVERGEECYCSADCYDKAIEYGIVDVPF